MSASNVIRFIPGLALVSCTLCACGQNSGQPSVAKVIAPHAVAKVANEWLVNTNDSSMDGRQIVATKNFAKTSQDGATTLTISAALTCVVPTKELTLTMRAVDTDKNGTAMPTRFDSKLDKLRNVPVGRLKSKESQPLPISSFVSLKQDDFLLWPISHLAASDSNAPSRMQMLFGTADKATMNSMMLGLAQMFGIVGAERYRDMNSMFSGERPWIFEVSTGKDPVEVIIPLQNAAVDQVLKMCGAGPNAPSTDTQEVAAKERPGAAPEPVRESDDQSAAASTPLEADPKKLVAAIPAQSTSAPSFDCAQATGRVEKMICRSATLAKADAELSTVYHRATQQATGDRLSSIKTAERDFVKQRNECQTADCVDGLYQTRLAQLRQAVAIN